MPPPPPPAQAVEERLLAIVAGLARRDLTILDRRLYRRRAEKLQTLAEEFGVSRERVRQVKERLKGRLERAVGSELDALAEEARGRLGHLARTERFEETLAELLPASDPLPGLGADDHLARRMLRARLDYDPEGDWLLDAAARAVIERLRAAARELADSAGLIDERALRARLLGGPSGVWAHAFPDLLEACGFPRACGRLALRATLTAQVKAALLNLGRPATKPEIAEACGLGLRQVAGVLLRHPDMGRRDKERWGLVEWYDEEYVGLPTMIERRIVAAGGEARLKVVAAELAAKFGVRENSVYSMTQAPRFRVRLGMISLVEPSSIRLRPLDAVVGGRTAEGRAYWDFQVQERFFRGYSVQQVPPEVACALGAEADGFALARVVRPSGCRELSVRWRVTSMSGASLGRVSDALRRLGAEEGDTVRVVILAPRRAELRLLRPG